MIATLRGVLLEKNPTAVIVEVNGVGWEVFINPSTYETLPAISSEVKFYISESTAMYGGSTTLYGFQTAVEKEIFELLRTMPGTGAKKSLEYLDKIKKSIGDFQSAVLRRDLAMLSTVFGFRKPTAEKLIAHLKDKITAVKAELPEKWINPDYIKLRNESVAILVALGYNQSQAKASVDEVLKDSSSGLKIEEIIKLALKKMWK